MLTYEQKKREELTKERGLEKELLGIMEKYKDESFDKIVKYKISIDNEKEKEAWDKFYNRIYTLLDEAKFFTPAYETIRPCRSCSITGTPGFARELCEFFVDYAGIKRDNIGEAEEVTEEEIEKEIEFRSELLIARLGWYEDETFGDSQGLIGLNNDKPPVKVLESYDGEISFTLDTERAFADLYYNYVMCNIKECLDNLVDTKYVIVEKAITEKTVSFNIKSKHNHCIALWDIFTKGFGRYNMKNRYLVIK